MRSFMYIVEMILVVILLMIFVFLFKQPTNVNSILSSLSDQNLLYEYAISFTNNNTYINVIDNNLDFLSYISYNALNIHVNLYSSRIDEYSTIYINNSSSCIAFLYPFPNILDNPYYINITNTSLPDFDIYNQYFIPCTNFTFSPDWYAVIINSYTYQGQYTNLSLTFYNKSIDPYSIFAYNTNIEQIPIYFVNVSYNYPYTFLNISLNPIPNNTPIILILRIKNNNNSPNLQYLNNNYYFSNNIQNAQNIGYNYDLEQLNWMTIYLSNQCLNSNYIIIKYSIPPKIIDYNLNNTGLNIQNCLGNISIYYSQPLIPIFYGNFPSDFGLYSAPKSSQYLSFSLIPDGLNIIKFLFYGS